ncbi:unnamed protein product, partial [Tuber aestivum]
PNTLTSVNNLAGVLESQGKYDESEEMHRRALAGRERIHGPDHPNNLTSCQQPGWGAAIPRKVRRIRRDASACTGGVREDSWTRSSKHPIKCQKPCYGGAAPGWAWRC